MPIATNPASTDVPARTPDRFRITATTGLQGKLVLCFLFLLTAALGASCWLFISETREMLGRISGDQARQLSRMLAKAGEPALDRGDATELNRIGSELMKSKGLVAVVFFDAAGRQMSISARDPDLQRPGLSFFRSPRDEPVSRGLVSGWTASLGHYTELMVPVTRATTAAGRGQGQVVGYVTVCVSQGDTEARMRNITLLVMLIGAVAVLVSVPSMYLLVHRIFGPIRDLVSATHRIAAGDLDAQVATNRGDVIGTLARSFNQMVQRIRGHQLELAQANDNLAKANDDLAHANNTLARLNEELETSNARLADVNRILEEKVQVRTGELEQANRRLSAEIADKDDFLRAVSHDLNAPLRNISGMASMLLMKHGSAFDPDVVHRLERIQKNVEVETGLIGELLELSRIKSRRQTFERVELGALVRDVSELFLQDLETNQIGVTLDNDLPGMTGERNRFRQIFQNLFDNAIKYMGAGSTPEALASAGHDVDSIDGREDGRVRMIHVGCHVGETGPIEFWVRDTGIGIEESELPNVFRVFRRGKNHAVQGIAGKGVGLASVKSIIETYDGAIRVESRVGAGSTFRFTIDRRFLADGKPGRVVPGTVRAA